MVYMYVHYVYIVGAHVVHINGEGLEPSVCVCVCMCVCVCTCVKSTSFGSRPSPAISYTSMCNTCTF